VERDALKPLGERSASNHVSPLRPPD
jgi:hypothetical protein